MTKSSHILERDAVHFAEVAGVPAQVALQRLLKVKCKFKNIHLHK